MVSLSFFSSFFSVASIISRPFTFLFLCIFIIIIFTFHILLSFFTIIFL